MHKMDAIIFDLDGTIVDTENLWAQATQDMLQSRGIAYDDDLKIKIHTNVHGLPPIKACQLLKEMVELQETAAQLAQEKTERAYKLIKGNVRFIHGFIDFFQSIHTKIKTAVATNSPHTLVTLISHELRLDRFFNKNIYTPSHVGGKAKPNPALYLYAAQRLSVEPNKCVVIEDSKAGIISAKKAGMYCVGLDSQKSGNLLPEAHEIVQNYNELISLIKNKTSC